MPSTVPLIRAVVPCALWGGPAGYWGYVCRAGFRGSAPPGVEGLDGGCDGLAGGCRVGGDGGGWGGRGWWGGVGWWGRGGGRGAGGVGVGGVGGRVAARGVGVAAGRGSRRGVLKDGLVPVRDLGNGCGASGPFSAPFPLRS